MNLNRGDFLFRVEGDVTSIATVSVRFENEDDVSYYLDAIESTGRSFNQGFLDAEELWDEGWRLLDKSVLRNVEVE